MSDSDYYCQREQAALRLAQQASDPGIKHIHLSMAQAYRRRQAEPAAEPAADRARSWSC